MSGENVGKAYVEIRADGTKLEQDIKDILRRIEATHQLNLKASLDLGNVKADLDRLAAEHPIALKATVDLAPVRAEIEKLRAETEANSVHVRVDADTNRAREEIRRVADDTHTHPVRIAAEAETASLESSIARSVTNINNNPASRPTIRPRVDTSGAERDIEKVTGKKFVDIIPKIPDDIKKGLVGLGYSIIGAIPAKTITGVFEEIAGNFEKNVFTMSKTATKWGSIGTEILAVAGDALTLASNLTDLLGIAALGPAAFTGLVGTMGVLKVSFTGFMQALNGNKQALAKFAPDVQSVILQLRDLRVEFSKPIQSAFWDNVGVTLIKLAKSDLPVFRDALVQHAKVLGNMFDEVLHSVDDFVQSGQMKKAFDGIDQGMANMSRAIRPVGDALNTLTVVGAAHMPALGDAIAKAGLHFADWIANADKAGKIDQWINNAITTMDQLGSITKSTVGIFSSLTTAAERAGSKGLAPFATTMHDIARTMSTDAVQTTLVKLFEDARVGAEALTTGLGKVWDGIMKNKDAIGAFLKEAGQVGGQFLDSVSKFFDGNFMSGVITAMAGFKNAMGELKPAFKDISNAIGDIGQVAAPMVEATADGFAHIAHTAAQVIDALKDGFKAVIPIFNNFMQGMIGVLSGPLVSFAKIVGDILLAFSKLPSSVQNVIMVAALLAVILPKVVGMFKDLSKGVGEFFNGVTKEVDGKQEVVKRGFLSFLPIEEFKAGLANIRQTFSDETGRMGEAWGKVGESAKNAFRQIGDSVRGALGTLGDATRGALTELGYNFGRLGTNIKNGLKNVFQDVLALAAVEARDLRDLFVQHASMIPVLLSPITGKIKAIFSDAVKLVLSELQPVVDGFKGLGGKIADGFTGAVGKVSQKFTDLGNWSKNVLQDMALRGAYAAKEIETGFKDLGTSIVQHLNMVPVAAKGIWETITTETRPIRQEIVGIFEDIPNVLTKMGIPVYDWADKAKAAFKDVGDRAVVMGRTIGEGVRNGIQTASEHVSDIADRAVAAGRRIGDGIGKAFDTISEHAQTVAGKVTSAFGTAGSAISDRFSRITDVVRGAMQTVGTEVAGTASAMAAHFSGVGDAIRTHLAPIGEAVGTLASNVGSAVGTTVTGMGRIAAAGAQAAGKTGMGAMNGLIDAMGGGWGLAIGAATTAITIWAQAQADAVQKTNELSQSLDQQTGAITNATKKIVAQQSLDGVTNDWDNFVRGVVERSGSVEESLSKMGVSTKDYTDKLADPKGRDAYVKGLQDIRNAMFAGTPITKEMAAAVGSTTEQLSHLNTGDLDHLATKAGDTAKRLTAAEVATRKLAEATGTNAAQAAILQKNYDTLNSSTSSVGDKFSALKENLQTLLDANDKLSQSTKNAQRDFGSSTLDFKENANAIKEANKGVVSDLYQVGVGFDYTNRQSINFSKAIEGQRDAILKLGVDALQKAQQNGESAADAQKAALAAMAPQIGNLQKMLADLGLSKPQIDGIIQEMGLVPDKLVTAIGVQGADEAKKEIIQTQIVAQAFATGHYEAMLAALPDEAKKQIEDATGLAGAFKDGNYSAILQALDMTKGGRDAALGAIATVVNGDYQTPIKAWNLTAPGLNGARVDIGSLTDKNWQAAIQAAYNATGDQHVRDMLNELTAARSVPIYANIIQGNADGTGDVTSANDSIHFHGGRIATGGILNGAGGGMFGFSPRYFANGGIEDHIAQIARPGIMPRVWAEAETGGEAYIPLSLAKRTRSLAILEQVAEMFGYRLSKSLQFFDGGIFTDVLRQSALASAASSSSSTSTARRTTPSAGAGASVNVNVYPSQGLSEEQIGRSAASELYWQLLNRPGMAR